MSNHFTFPTLIKSKEPKNPLKSYRTYNSTDHLYSVLETECKNFKVTLNKPKDMTSFQAALDILMKERQKAENVFLDDVENDIENKERFIN